MKTIKLSNPPWWFIVGGLAAYALAIAYTPLQYLWWVTQGAPQVPMVPPQIAYVGGYKDAIMPTLAISMLVAMIWFVTSFIRQAVHNVATSLRKRRKHRQEGRDLAAFAGDYPVLSQEVTPAQTRKYDDPGGLVPSWIATKCRIIKDGKVSLELARDSFRLFCNQQTRDGNPHSPPNNLHWFPGVLRQLGYKVAYLPKNKDDPNSKPGRGIYGLTIR